MTGFYPQVRSPTASEVHAAADVLERVSRLYGAHSPADYEWSAARLRTEAPHIQTVNAGQSCICTHYLSEHDEHRLGGRCRHRDADEQRCDWPGFEAEPDE